jgi:uncharacterized protein
MNNHFTWYELMTTDTAGAKAFYASVMGWGDQTPPQSPIPYTLFTAGSVPVAGMMDLPESAKAMGIPPNWLGYVAVEDIDAAAAKATGLGATIQVGPMDIPNVGRFCCLSDPQGAVISLFRWTDAIGQGGPRDSMSPGQIGWHELVTTDWQQGFAFYEAMFGWKKADAIDMGEMGTYQMFAAGTQTLGGMMNRPPGMPVSAWTFYVNVPAIDAAIARVNAGGGTVMNGPMEVPGGSWIAQCRDPQGAFFAMVAPGR